MSEVTTPEEPEEGGPRRFENPALHEVVTVLESSAETDGARTVLELEIAPGARAPRRSHGTHDVTLRVRKGTLAIDIGGKRQDVGQGQRVDIPQETPHNWANAGEAPVFARLEMRPGNEGYERFVRVSAGLARDGRTFRDGTPKSPLALAVLLDWGGVRLPDARLVEIVLTRLRPVARRFGVPERLERSYP